MEIVVLMTSAETGQTVHILCRFDDDRDQYELLITYCDGEKREAEPYSNFRERLNVWPELHPIPERSDINFIAGELLREWMIGHPAPLLPEPEWDLEEFLKSEAASV